jgi:hypothetical protein
MTEEPSETRLRRRNFWRMFPGFLLLALVMGGIRGFIYFLVASALYFTLKRIAGDWSQDAQAIPNVYFLIASVAVAIALPFGVNFGVEKFGAELPGALFERSEYEARLYVHLYPEAQKVMSYRVPAMVSASIEEDHYDGEHSHREYWLRSAFMPKGGRIDFDDCRVKLQETVHCFDTSQRRWGVVLTPTPAI